MTDILVKDSKYPQYTLEASKFSNDINRHISNIVKLGCSYGFTEEQIKSITNDLVTAHFCGKRLFDDKK